MFKEYPYINLTDLNLDWLMKLVKEVNEKLSEYLENSVITFADPITWNITEQYTALTCVVDADGTAYLSKQPVPTGVDISNTNYWLPIFNYDDNINTLRSQIAYNARNSATIGQALQAGDLVFWNGLIYQALNDMPAGSAIVVDGNVRKYTVDEKINDEITARINADGTLQQNIDDEEAARILADGTLQQHIDDEEAARIAADGVLQQHIDDEETARIGADGTLQQNIDDEEAARILAINGLQQQINSLDNDFVKPEDYGAVGDGTTDDSHAMGLCFADAVAQNRYVRLTKVYAIGAQVAIPNNLTVQGFGSGGFKDIATFPSSSDLSTYALFYANTKSNIVFNNVSFIGKGTSTHYDRKYTILLQDSRRVYINNCAFTNQSGVAVVYARHCNDVWVMNSSITEYTYAGVQFVEGTSQSGVLYSRIVNGHETVSPNRYPIMLCGYDVDYSGSTAPSGRDLYAIGNYIQDAAPWWEGIDAHGGYRLFISHNTIYNVASPLAIFSDNARGFECRYAFIHDNVCSATTTEINNAGANIGNAFGGHQMKIHNNFFENGGNAYKNASSTQIYFNESYNCTFENNNVINSYGHIMSFSGIYSGMTIRGNNFDGLTPTTNIAFDMRNADIYSYFLFESNMFSNYTSHFAAPATKTETNQYIRLNNNKYGVTENPSFTNVQFISPDYAISTQIAQSTCCKNGDICINRNAASGSVMGWIGTGASHGTGVWKPLPNIGS